MRLIKLANWLSEGDLEKYQQQARRAEAAQGKLKNAESELHKLKSEFQKVQKELSQTKAQLQINQGFQQELGETQLKLQRTNAEVQRHKKNLFEQTKQIAILQSQLAQAKQTVTKSQNWKEQITNPVRVEKIEKTLSKQDFDTLWGFGIMTPQVESITTTGSIIIKGWVLGKKAKAKTLQVTYQTETILEVPIEVRRPRIAEQYPDINTASSCGFEFPLTVMGISKETEFSLSAILEDQSIVPLCIIVFQPAPIESKDT